MHARLAQAGDGGVERAGGLRIAECVLRAADQQVAVADIRDGPALLSIALGKAELIAAALKRLRRLASGEDQVAVQVALEGEAAF